MKTQTVWVDVRMTTSEKVAVQVPSELGRISAMEFAEKKIASLPPSERLGPGSKKIEWEYNADKPE